MRDGVIRGLLQHASLKVSVALVTETARVARQRHGLHPAAATLLGQAIAGGVLLASLQKDDSRINLQLECDGALRGLLVDASAQGAVRGYVKNPLVDVELSGEYRWRAALGNHGFLSVLREIGPGEFYRSSVELKAMSLSDDLNRYFASSDQVATRVAVVALKSPREGLEVVAGVLVQALPDGDLAELSRSGDGLEARLEQALADSALHTPTALAQHLFGALGLTVMASTDVGWKCSCSKERVLETLASLGRAEVQDILDTTGSTAVTCHFCGTKHEVSFPELVALLERLSLSPPKN